MLEKRRKREAPKKKLNKIYNSYDDNENKYFEKNNSFFLTVLITLYINRACLITLFI